MKNVSFRIVGVSPYSQSRPFMEVDEKADDREDKHEREKRIWRQRLHVEKGEVVIPASAIKNCLAECAKYLSIKVPGKGHATYTKHFDAGLLFTENVPLGVDPKDVEGEWLYLDANGTKGSGKRVWRCYPVLREWSGTVTGQILDDIITEEMFLLHAAQAGRFIGIGRFRPRNGGTYGRFSIENLEVEKVTV